MKSMTDLDKLAQMKRNKKDPRNKKWTVSSRRGESVHYCRPRNTAEPRQRLVELKTTTTKT